MNKILELFCQMQARSYSTSGEWIVQSLNDSVEVSLDDLKLFGAQLRIFSSALPSCTREEGLNLVDKIYIKILHDRRSKGLMHALDDYLVLLKAGPNQTYIDEELERDWRVCRTFVWNLDFEDVHSFIQRTPFAELPRQHNEEESLKSLFREFSFDLRPWISLGASGMAETSLNEWINCLDYERGLLR